MERKGLVKKSNDLHRKNIVRVRLTKKGREALISSVERNSIHTIMECISYDERMVLKKTLERILAEADQVNENYRNNKTSGYY
jgi:DNA-binding MarR family transcriptional regulator